MVALFDLIRKVAPVDVPVLISGESGTGKDLVARAVHGLSRRAGQTFLSINCAAVPETLLESELFGHERGAFSGAERARPGYFREADGGTLFLDEIGDMSLGQQSKLLRVLESGELIPVGSEHPIHVDVRLVAATNRNLETMAADGSFRNDLLFRIDTVRLEIPALRERREDIPILVAYFLERVPSTGGAAPRMGAAAMKAVLDYPWPGNVRELEHAIEHAALVSSGDVILPDDLPARVRAQLAGGGAARFNTEGTFRQAKAEFERAYFKDLLERTEGNITQAARLAGIHRATFHDKLHKLGLV
jgi:two-component system response regulator HydG